MDARIPTVTSRRTNRARMNMFISERQKKYCARPVGIVSSREARCGMAELKRCPECGGVATVIHMYDTYDRADFGWDAGCGRYRAGDGLHTKKMKVSGLPSKEKAIEAWNRVADNG